MNIAIDENKNIIYEGSGYYGYALNPSPLISPAAIAPPSENPVDHAPQGHGQHLEYLFREDDFDPVTRIRRGRFYRFTGTQRWHVTVHPVALAQYSEHERTHRTRDCDIFSHTSLWSQFLRQGEPRPLVILGSKDRYTLWRILSIETNISGEEIVVLKGRHSFGALPDVDREKIPVERRGKVLSTLEKLQEDIFRASPASVIDRARDACTAILKAFLGDDPSLKVDADLGRFIRRLEEKNLYENVRYAAGIVRIFHSRAKPSIQEKIQDIREAQEQDAELAVQCVGTILCDLGWAVWR